MSLQIIPMKFPKINIFYLNSQFPYSRTPDTNWTTVRKVPLKSSFLWTNTRKSIFAHLRNCRPLLVTLNYKELVAITLRLLFLRVYGLLLLKTMMVGTSGRKLRKQVICVFFIVQVTSFIFNFNFLVSSTAIQFQPVFQRIKSRCSSLKSGIFGNKNFLLSRIIV